MATEIDKERIAKQVAEASRQASTRYPFVASDLEKAELGNAYDPLQRFTYQEDEVRSYGPITEENHDHDQALKVARLQEDINQNPQSAPQVSTYDGTRSIQATPAAIQQLFSDDPAEVLTELANQVILRKAEQQQLYMY